MSGTADQVLQFLSDKNRPFTVNDIVQGLEGKIPKNQVVSSLNKLLEQNRIIEKNCGKQKIYCVAQKGGLAKQENSTALDIDRKCKSLEVKLQEVEKDLGRKEEELKKLEGKLTKDQVLEKKKKLEVEIKDIQLKLESFQGERIDKEEREKIEREYRNVLKEYNKRKRLCTDMVEAIFENYPKTKKHLLQEIGIENDEDAGFKVKVQIK